MMSEALIINPNVRLRAEQGAGAVEAISVRAPVRGDSLRVKTIKRDEDPTLFGVLLIYLLTQRADLSPDRLGENDRQRLAEIGFLLTEDQVSTPVFFDCDMLESPPEAVEPLTDVQPLGTEGPTREMRGRLELPNPFRRDRQWFRLESDRAAAPSFYSCPIDKTSEAQRLLDGRHTRDVADPQIRDGQVSRAHRELVSKRYTVLDKLIHPLELAALRRYYRDLISEGFVQFADQDWPDRYFAKRDALAYCFHQQLTGVVSEIAGEPVKPSFAFLTSYRPGAILHPHKDRAQCHYSLSILLDHTPEPADVSPWPIYVQPPQAQEATPVRIAVGDALMYFGEEVLHYRDALPANHTSTLWFFFYVPVSFAESLD